MTPLEPTITPKQLARAIGVSESSVKRWCDDGLIECVRTAGGHRRLLRDSAWQYAQHAGYSAVATQELDMPSATGSTDRLLHRGCGLLRDALSAADDVVAQRTVLDLRDAGFSIASIFDDVIVPVIDANIDAIALQICSRILHRLRTEQEPAASDAPLALTAGLDETPHTLHLSAAALVFAETGFNATVLGTGLPFVTLTSAVQRLKPKLLFLQCDRIRDSAEFSRRFASLRGIAGPRKTSLAIAVPAESGGDCGDLKADHVFEDFCRLEKFANGLIRRTKRDRKH